MNYKNTLCAMVAGTVICLSGYAHEKVQPDTTEKKIPKPSEKQDYKFLKNGNYEYNGMIGKDWIHFKSDKDVISITVKLEEGAHISFWDYQPKDLKIDKVEVYVGRALKQYKGKDILRKAQKKFDVYLKDIAKKVLSSKTKKESKFDLLLNKYLSK